MREWIRPRMAVLSTWERSVVATLLTVTPLALISGQWLSIVSLLAVTALAVEANYWHERCRRGQPFTDLGMVAALRLYEAKRDGRQAITFRHVGDGWVMDHE